MSNILLIDKVSTFLTSTNDKFYISNFFAENPFVKYRNVIIPAIIIITVLIIAIIVIYFDDLKRRRITKELTKAKNDLNYIVNHDYLTDLLNRKVFEEHLNNKISKEEGCAVLLIDVDNFKKLNDTLGHTVGDALLMEVASRISKVCTNEFSIYRFAGDEFVAIIDSNNKTIINSYIDKIQNSFLEPFEMCENSFIIRISIGIARYPMDATTREVLISSADSAMYNVKQNGKNNYSYYNQEMHNNLKSSVEIEQLLQTAIDNDGFKVLFQPQVSVRNGKIFSCEALLRLKDSNISPAKFIPVAEETGQIISIGRIVVKKVIEQLKEWKDQGFAPKVISINFSTIQIRDKSYLDYIMSLLKKHQIEPRTIEIEITESIFLDKSKSNIEFINKIKEYGLRLALDDFGTGYSSINYLTDFNFDVVKLDKSLIERFLVTGNSEIAKMIISLVHSLDMLVVAEGVETFEQFNLLRKYNCDLIQGFLFSKPIEASELKLLFDKEFVEDLYKNI